MFYIAPEARFMALNLKSSRADELATRLAAARGISKTRLIEDLLEREWRTQCLTAGDVEAIARAFRERNGIAPGSGDPRPSSEIIDEAWGER
jgi:hypothetical protein